MKLYIIRIHGRVHGVGYRISACEKARELHLTGFVRNQPDGSVYIEAEGELENLHNFFDWCSQGPRHSLVQKAEFEVSDDLRHFKNFAAL